MAFLDNSGDIILDAVLTDAGRQRMARGDFRIVKFALGDEEINYELYNSGHPSGSLYYDLDIMQTPIMEAFTNNTASMKSKLMSLSRENILHLPILRMNEVRTRNNTPISPSLNGIFLVTANKDTETALETATTGVLFGVNNSGVEDGSIMIDQGMDTAGDPPITDRIPRDLMESQYIIQIDNRLGTIITADGRRARQAPAFIDDDNIATYYFGLNDSSIVSTTNFAASLGPDPTSADIERLRKSGPEASPFNGPLGSRLNFKIRSSNQIRTSAALFTKLGGDSTVTVVGTGGSNPTCYYIDTNVRVTGITTGYSMDIPVRFVRKV